MKIKRIAVVGGGISGLALAHRLFELKEKSPSVYEIALFESGHRLGGTIETERKDGFLLEKGPDSFISDKPWALDLCKRLGLESELIGTRNENRKSFVVRDGKLLEVPPGFYLIAPTQIQEFLKSPLFSFAGKSRMMLEPFIPHRVSDEDESIGAFIRRRFGRECLDRVGQAMIAGIYTGDPENLSLLATMPRLKDLEKKYGSVILGLLSGTNKKKKDLNQASGPRYSLFLSFKEGLETLTKKLSTKIPGSSVRLGSKIKKIEKDTRDGSWRLITENGGMEAADILCLTTPADVSSLFMEKISPELSKKLSRISYESVATINFAFRRSDIGHALNGFGFVVPRIENRQLVACSFSSQKFDQRAPEGMALLRVFVGGVFGRDVFAMGDQALESLALQDLSALLKISGKPLFSCLSRYPGAMVQYGVNHLNLVSDIENESRKYSGLFLTGSSYRGVGIPDCIRDAERVAEQIAKGLS